MDGGVTLVEGATFCVCDEVGDVEPGGVAGLYVRDTRVLSTWRLRVDGRAVQPLVWFGDAPFQATFLGRAGSLLVRRDRYVGSGWREDLTLANHSAEATFAEVTIEVDADFADVFEVRAGAVVAGALRGRGERSVRPEAHGLMYEYRWRDRARACRVQAGADATVLPGVLVFRALVPARGEWSASIGVSTGVDGEPLPPAFAPGEPVAEAAPVRRHERWQQETPTIETSDPELRRTFERSRADLGSLRIEDGAGGTAVAAGSPWYMTLFGRDSLLTAYLALPLDQALAVGTLRMLARHQGKTTDAATEEEPGKILHELRSGIDPGLNLGGSHVYYGTVDATPLFVVLVGELSRWGVDVEEFLPHVDRALQWLQGHDGFVSYRRRTDRGLVNQGWKDSWDGVNFADGRLAMAPVALAEVQGYAYAAYRARAELADQRGDEATARHCRRLAAELRERFEEAFWLPDRGWYAVAVDGDGRPVDALTSNIGHCLWSGIVAPDRAARVADQLLSEAMFSGWGVRTLASTMGAYDPVSYHNGSVWPHDNALVAAGLMGYGHVEHAQRVATAILDAAARFGGRLPELFCGFGRGDYPEPVPYPTSCSPQAWAAAAPIQLLRTLLGLDPDVPRGELRLAPALPPGMANVSLRGVPVAGSRIDLTSTGLEGAGGLTMVRERRGPA